MDLNLAAEMWDASEGGEMPAEFRKTVESYMRHKSALTPQPFTEGDFAACVMNYKLFKALASKKAAKKEEPKEEPKEGPKEPPKEPPKDE